MLQKTHLTSFFFCKATQNVAKILGPSGGPHTSFFVLSLGRGLIPVVSSRLTFRMSHHVTCTGPAIVVCVGLICPKSTGYLCGVLEVARNRGKRQVMLSPNQSTPLFWGSRIQTLQIWIMSIRVQYPTGVS